MKRARTAICTALAAAFLMVPSAAFADGGKRECTSSAQARAVSISMPATCADESFGIGNIRIYLDGSPVAYELFDGVNAHLDKDASTLRISGIPMHVTRISMRMLEPGIFTTC